MTKTLGRVSGIQTGDRWGWWGAEGGGWWGSGEPVPGCVSWEFQNKNNEHKGEARFIDRTAKKSLQLKKGRNLLVTGIFHVLNRRNKNKHTNSLVS